MGLGDEEIIPFIASFNDRGEQNFIVVEDFWRKQCHFVTQACQKSNVILWQHFPVSAHFLVQQKMAKKTISTEKKN